MNKETTAENLDSKLIYIQTLVEPIITTGDAKRFVEDKYFSGYHEQDCCEEVYIDMNNSDMYKSQIKEGQSINIIEYWTCPEDGFLIKLYDEQKYIGHIYYPCYNSQNGYYSSRLDLCINDKLNPCFNLNELECVKDI